ncbi:glycosyltransferase family 4 protein [Candidatus Parcubacteria bacterium]|nr:glycosyltransferase family 4 protein [Candidatus Parcubacteria bacterium]
MTICYFGDYDPSYNRTKLLLKGLHLAGVEVLECNVRGKGGIALYRDLFRKHRPLAGKYDLLFVGYGNARLMPVFARLLTRRPVVWDALYSLYDNWVFDRKLTRPHSAKAYWYWCIDWLDCFASDLVVLDTWTNADYFTHTFGVPVRKLVRVFVGADTNIFYPRARAVRPRSFEVEFHGKYIPVQGTKVLVRAAKLLENDAVHITMIGSGQDFSKTRRLADELHVTNITFLPFLPLAEVAEYVRNADVCVGLVGNVPRVVRAIPNKLYEAAAAGRVSVSADTSSLREIFTPGIDTLGVSAGNPEDLAQAIRKLKQAGNAETLGAAAHAAFMRRCTAEAIAAQLMAALTRVSAVRSGSKPEANTLPYDI